MHFLCCSSPFFSRTTSQNASFRWPEIWQDIALAKQVVSDRPTKPADWEILANALNTVFSREGSKVSLKGILNDYTKAIYD